MSARFEVVRTEADQPWHARFVAENNEIVWTSENYAERADARNAIFLTGAAWEAGSEIIDVDLRTSEPIPVEDDDDDDL